ncbi:MAG: hypothetical protein ACYSTZ_09380 [Planctomycetota bacterium]|jgi:hypothetical protein
MKAFGAVVRMFLFFVLLGGAGCEWKRVDPPVGSGPDGLAVHSPYAPAEVSMLPLTRFVSGGAEEGMLRIEAYVSLVDSFDCQIKAPGSFRFELYEYVERSSDPKGKRIALWADVDLADAAQNNSYWQDYLRAYKFSLDFEQQGGSDYVLQATCLVPSGKRLSDDFVLRHPK